jgi:IS30 family transposase
VLVHDFPQDAVGQAIPYGIYTLNDNASRAAHQVACARRKAARRWPKLHVQGKLWMVVSACLSWRWSPQQIAATLARMWPNDPSMHVSHETIYTAIYALASGELRRLLIACLRQGKSHASGACVR